MRCGIESVREYLKLLNVDYTLVVEELDKRVTENGVSVYDIIDVLGNYEIEAHAYKCFFVYPNAPFIIYLFSKKHYILIKRVGLLVELFDINVGWVKIPLIVYFFINKRYIIVLDKK